MSAAVIAGGRSRRMGRDKAMLPAPPFRSLLERQLSLFASLAPREYLVSCRSGQALPASQWYSTVHDNGMAGPLGGLVEILRAIRTPRVLLVGVDLARIDGAMLRRIAGAAADDDERVGVVPRTGAVAQPLAALWPRAMLAQAEEQLADGTDLSLRSLVSRGVEAGLLRWFEVPSWDEPRFANWNRPTDVTRVA